jgi:hypothetical protein
MTPLPAPALRLLPRRGLCPCCGSTPAAGVVTQSGQTPGTRYLYCSLCGAAWKHVRAVCIRCGQSRSVVLQGIEGDSGTVKAETCNDCHTYAKMLYQARALKTDPFRRPCDAGAGCFGCRGRPVTSRAESTAPHRVAWRRLLRLGGRRCRVIRFPRNIVGFATLQANAGRTNSRGKTAKISREPYYRTPARSASKEKRCGRFQRKWSPRSGVRVC